ncbi:hypothetical protein J2T09_002314 [Neorhizobium huautlense]|uniref:Uncharacterized protein n=1 Tax=Neorhizobium huautlense TaxID=67774 RepID=A0ABT9PSX2_9HYPH|nr:hypothetical protein [Neorhizobium huautlense]MDP9837562.1 hypothetical protein [Neorhizobium huautlense]
MTNPDTHTCPICAEPFKPDDICATDITEGPCHAACLEGSPVVDLDTGEELPESELHTYPYSEVMEPAPPQTKSVLRPIVGPEALTPSAEPLGENISEIRASEGRETVDSGLTALFDNLGAARVAEDSGTAFHNELRTEARAQASPSRREIGDAADMERMTEKETPAPPQTILDTEDGR